MQMQLGLLHQNSGVHRRVEALHKNREHLRNPEPNVGKQDLIARAGYPEPDLMLWAILPDRDHTERFNQAECLELLRDERLQGPEAIAVTKIQAPILPGQDRLDSQLTCGANSRRRAS